MTRRRTGRATMVAMLAFIAAAAIGSPSGRITHQPPVAGDGALTAHAELDDDAATDLRSRDGRLTMDDVSITVIEESIIAGGWFSMEADLAAVEIESLSGDGFEMTAEIGEVFDAVIIVDDDLLAPDAVGGLIECEGDLMLTDSATVLITLAGPAAEDEYGRLVVHGVAELGGTLIVTIGEGFEPHIGDEFIIIIADAITGEFAEVVLPEVNPAATLRIEVRQSEAAIIVERNAEVESEPRP